MDVFNWMRYFQVGLGMLVPQIRENAFFGGVVVINAACDLLDFLNLTCSIMWIFFFFCVWILINCNHAFGEVESQQLDTKIGFSQAITDKCLPG